MEEKQIGEEIDQVEQQFCCHRGQYGDDTGHPDDPEQRGVGSEVSPLV
jgi:hypothetical protein